MVESLKEKVLRITLEELDFSVRTYSCLKRAGINDIEDLIKMSYDDLYRIKNLNLKCREEVVRKLASIGLGLQD